MRARRVGRIGGFSALEGALCFSFLLALICGAVITVEYLWTGSLVNRLVDKGLYETMARPLAIGVQQDQIVVRVREKEIREALTSMVERAASELENDFVSWSKGAFLVEATYRLISIDPIKGSVQLINDPGFLLRIGQLDPNRGWDSDWQHEFTKLTGNPSQADSPAPIALPRGSHGLVEDGHYLPEVALLGLRVTVGYPDGLGNWLRQTTGLSATITAAKAVILRGVVQ